MATWIVHLRIADNIINQKLIPNEYKCEFIYGSLAPDCGYGKKDSLGEFTPPPSVTHWASDGCKVFCEYTKFYNTYLKNKEKNSDYYFYLGYYTHLLTDVLWSASIYIPSRMKYADEYRHNREFINTVKKDWYALDFDFLNQTPNFEPITIIQDMNSVKDYLPYYEHNQLTIQIKFIADYYNKNLRTHTSDTYKYLTETEMSEFIQIATEYISKKL